MLQPGLPSNQQSDSAWYISQTAMMIRYGVNAQGFSCCESNCKCGMYEVQRAETTSHERYLDRNGGRAFELLFSTCCDV